MIPEKYEKDAEKYWDMFYKRNANRVIGAGLATNPCLTDVMDTFLYTVI